MNNLYFWKTWNSPYKQLYFFLLFIFFITISSLFYAMYVGSDGVIKWDVETELEPVKIVVDQFTQNLFNITVESNGYYALDKFVATEVQVNPFIAYGYLSVIIVCMLFIITTLSYLEVYWFMAGMLSLLFFLFTLNIEMLQLFGRVDRMPTVVIFILYSGVSYFYNSFRKYASYLTRLITFLLITILIAFVIYKYSLVSTPFLYLANFGSLFPVAVTMVFVVLVGYDIIKGFLYLISSKKSTGSKNSLLNFIFASLLYLVNVFLLLMKKLYLLDLNIIYLNAFFLLAFSALLGIWMYKKRTEMFSAVLPFTPAGAYVYLSLAIISLSGAVYAFLNGNNGIIESYERIIVYGHLFFGGFFFIYVLVNFLTLFDKKISIYDIVYKPIRLTFMIVPVAGIAAMVFFFLYQKKYPYHLAMAGYYTYAGDVMQYESDYPLALQYYQKAVSYDYPNHRANYSIATLSSGLKNKHIAIGYYENALYRSPTIQSHIGLSNVYFETGQLFKALFQLQDGLKQFPNDGRLYNNLAVMFHKSNIPDSSIYYFLKAKDRLKEKQVPFSNVLYLMAKNNLFNDADSLMATESYPTHLSFVNNKLAIYNQLNKKSEIPFDTSVVKDSLLNAITYAYLVNNNINTLRDSSKSIAKIIDSKTGVYANDFFNENLNYQLVLKKYYTGNIKDAVRELIEMDNNTSSTNFEFSTTLGKWMMNQRQFVTASEYFQKASKGGDLNTQLNYTIAASMASKMEDALFVLEQLKKSPDKGITSSASKLISILSIKNNKEALKLEEDERLQYFTIKLNNSKKPEDLLLIYNSFENEQAKIYAGVFLADFYILNNEFEKAGGIISKIKNIQNANEYAQGERNYVELLLNSEIGNLEFLSNNLETIKLNSDKELYRDYFRARKYELNKDSVQTMFYYSKLLSQCPYFEKAVSKAINYLSFHGKERFAYNNLIDILQLNPSLGMKRSYLDLCIRMGLISYSEYALDDLKGSLNIEDYQRYSEIIKKIQ